MSEPNNDTIQDAVLRHIDDELLEGGLQIGIYACEVAWGHGILHEDQLMELWLAVLVWSSHKTMPVHLCRG